MSKNRYISTDIKKKVKERAKHLCEYCKCPKSYAPGPFDIEHSIPLSKNGTSDLINLAYSCNGCNGFKYNKVEGIDPISGKSCFLFHPRKNKWVDHFTWSDDGLTILGITIIGRTTIKLLKLNRTELINIRQLLQLVGEHPPKED
jgi:hypothetical protein